MDDNTAALRAALGGWQAVAALGSEQRQLGRVRLRFAVAAWRGAVGGRAFWEQCAAAAQAGRKAEGHKLGVWGGGYQKQI